MSEPGVLPKRIIWAFAFGYFVCYAPYAAAVKILSSRGTALEIFPSVVAGTILGLAITFFVLGWWRQARLVREPRRIVAAFGEASLIAATTFAYTFSGISIVLALLLMRGGVLTLAPAVDLAYGRRVRWFARTSLAFALVSVAYALAHAGDYSLPWLAGVNLAFYLGGYMLRLPAMTRLAKVNDLAITRQYFVDEAVVAAATLAAAPLLAALLPLGTVSAQLRFGLTHITLAGVVTGLFYSGLHLFGTLIYLDWRENTFCISLNRCTSLLAGIFASLAVTSSWNVAAVPPSQLVAAGIMLAALALLSPAHHILDFMVVPLARRLGVAPVPEEP
jgi:hypothetical protein